MIPDLFASFQPDADELLRRVSQHVDAQMLDEIAAADHGYKAEEHLAHLLPIRDQGSFAVPMRWHPKEVLELVRWREPENPKTPAPGERGHWMRAFACTALLRAAGEPANQGLREGSNQTLIQLIGSLRAVGPELYGPAAALLAWLILRMKQYDETEELGFFMIGLLWLAVHVPASIPDDIVVTLSERIAAEAQRRSAERRGPHPERWLLGTTFHDIKHAGWERLGLELVEMDLSDRAPPAREWISLIGGKLAGRG
jgi:hypothetical protein